MRTFLSILNRRAGTRQCATEPRPLREIKSERVAEFDSITQFHLHNGVTGWALTRCIDSEGRVQAIYRWILKIGKATGPNEAPSICILNFHSLHEVSRWAESEFERLRAPIPLPLTFARSSDRRTSTANP